MNHSKKIRYILLLFVLVFTLQLKANHLVGGTMSYECLGNNIYKISLTIYRDCSSGTAFDTQAPIAIYDVNNTLVSNQLANFPGSSNVPIIINNPCLIAPQNVCVEKAEYEAIVNLPPSPGGYTVVYQRCCRNSNAVNINNPGAMGSTYKVHIPEQNLAVCNSSPTFNNAPPTVMCEGYRFSYDLSATDIDGDSLVYLFADPINGGSTATPAPSPPASPPYSNIPWAAGFSTNNQINSNPQFTIDPSTGFLIGTPLNQGFYTFSIKVQEYRNGVFLDEIYRDFILVITNCQSNTIADFPVQTNYCDGLALNFNNTSTNSTYFYWDFGDLSTLSDTSNLSLPSYTYADTGVYNVMLVANPGYFCADTIFRQFEIYPKILPSFNSITDTCLNNNEYHIKGLGNYDGNGVLTWSYSGQTTSQNFTPDSIQVNFLDTGNQVITFTITDNGCVETYKDSVYIYPNPVADILSQSIYCDGLAYDFTNLSTHATSFFWDFGVNSIQSDTSLLYSPLYLYPDTGIFEVTLVASQMNLCYDTINKFFNLKEDLNVKFLPDTLCFINNLFTLDVIGNQNSLATYFWDLGSFANISTSTNPQVQITFQDTGFYPISLTVDNYGCTFTYVDTLGVYPNPIPLFSIDTNLGCQPLLINFYDSSYLYSSASYLWDFGDNSSSTQQNPNHIYSSPGIFDVSITVITDSFCVDTVTLKLNNIITVNPKPIANFSVNTTEIYFMNHVIELTDLSNELYQEFNMGDGTLFLDEHVFYEYNDPGYYDVFQIVTNQFQCSDTSIKTIWIKPDLLVFVPNAFTPNNDGLNDIFSPKVSGIIDYNLNIFNRWGELIFTSNNMLNGWDGSYQNIACQEEVYTWVLKIKTVDYLTPTYRGHISLIR